MKALIHGTGLIGASIGLALRAAGWEVSGWDPSPSVLRAALRRGAVSTTAKDSHQGLDQADLVVLAGPPAAIVEWLSKGETETLVTDVAGVKVPVVRAARHLPHFVGGHPMAGREQAGPAFASASLFRGASWILTEDGASRDDLARMTGIVTSLGAQPFTMSAEEHDAAVATISHLPHLLAAALLELAARDPRALRLAAGSFRDLTRVAQSEPGWWTDVLLGNADEVVRAIDALGRQLGEWKQAIMESRVGEVAATLQRARETRSELGPQAVDVRVVLEDRPGELALIGRALEASAVDVRDIQLRHGDHGGVLTLTVRPGEAEALRQALTDQGFPLVN